MTNVLSLFSGCGGLDLGFVQAGFSVTNAFEADARAVKVYNDNFAHPAHAARLSEDTALNIKADLVIAGPPCQGFSTASGYTKIDPRNSLLLVACKLAMKASPKVIVIENVSGLQNAKNRDFLEAAAQCMTEAGYHVDLRLVECENFGVAQRRRRLFIVARSGGRPFAYDLSPFGQEAMKVADALRNIPAGTSGHAPSLLPEGSTHRLIFDRILPGQKLCNVRAGSNCVHTWDIPKVFGDTSNQEKAILRSIQKARRVNRRRSYGDADPVSQETVNQLVGYDSSQVVHSLVQRNYLRHVEGYVDLTHTFNGKYRKLDNAGVSPTVDTHFGDFRLFLHPDEPRGLTAREAARLQGFPDDFRFSHVDAEAYKQIGNAVPPPVAKTVANFVRHLI